MTFKNKKIILTGASSGIGLELLRYLIENKADVFAASRRQKEILADDEKMCQFDIIDLTNESEVEQYVERITSSAGKIDILINNAGVAQDLSLVEESGYEEFQSVIKDNVMTTFNMIKYVLPIMKKQNSGIIINMSSRSGRRGVPRLSAYCAAKFAVRGLTESVAKEVENNNIRCISISPGGVNTEMRRKLFGDEDAGNQQPTSRIINIITKILSEQIQVPNGADVLIVKDKEPIIKVPES
tara:strand:- start:769 stop:1491 length:723 start_codon:yes stop_codon:yes gene_type:complete